MTSFTISVCPLRSIKLKVDISSLTKIKELNSLNTNTTKHDAAETCITIVSHTLI